MRTRTRASRSWSATARRLEANAGDKLHHCQQRCGSGAPILVDRESKAPTVFLRPSVFACTPIQREDRWQVPPCGQAEESDGRTTLHRRAKQRLRVAAAGARPSCCRANAAGAIQNLAVDADNKMALKELGAGPKLLELLDDGTVGAKENAAGAIWNLACEKVEENTITQQFSGWISCVSFKETCFIVPAGSTHASR